MCPAGLLRGESGRAAPRSAGAEGGGHRSGDRRALQQVVHRRRPVQDPDGHRQVEGAGVVGVGRGRDAAVERDLRRQLGDRRVRRQVRVGDGHDDLAEVGGLTPGVRQGPVVDRHRRADGHDVRGHVAGVRQGDRPGLRVRQAGDQVDVVQRADHAGLQVAGVGATVHRGGRREVGADRTAAGDEGHAGGGAGDRERERGDGETTTGLAGG